MILVFSNIFFTTFPFEKIKLIGTSMHKLKLTSGVFGTKSESYFVYSFIMNLFVYSLNVDYKYPSV